ncbi:hypothetical protein SteCoe_36879 [Stentor coeruleus]|uniref:non-specific serine/threonine protein kinase n=1 Tax=Stentor coeruleus TaxID=5963 RepID=A0A1R2APF0_9CILI|nr:hypothetical protein SteCoe_36879 [Stentor coeruleus]
MVLLLALLLSLQKVHSHNSQINILSKETLDFSSDLNYNSENSHLQHIHSETSSAYHEQDMSFNLKNQDHQSFSYILSTTQMISLIILLCFAGLFGFCCGIKKKVQNSISFEPKSPLSNRSTAVSLFSSSSRYSSESPELILSTDQFSHIPVEKLFLNGSYLKNFTEHSLLWENKLEEVFLAEHKLDKQIYLVKKIPLQLNQGDNLTEQKLFQEVNRIKKLDCRHIARYVTCWIEESPKISNENSSEILLFVQMEYIRGISLRQWLEKYFTPELGLKAIKQISKVLEYLHSRGIPHGEISLDNIFLDKYHNVVVGDYDYTRCICDDRKKFFDIVLYVLKYFSDKNEAVRKILLFEYIIETGLDVKFEEYCLEIDN